LSLQPITGDRFLQRGLDYSEYKDAYTQHFLSQNRNTVSNKTNLANFIESNQAHDIYIQAIHKLHISVVPEFMPCRTSEKTQLMTQLRQYIIGAESPKPIYISGMPGFLKSYFLLYS
jgi:hypothetical protein